MKVNIDKEMKKSGREEFCLPMVEAKYLQMYINKAAPEIRISDCEVILKHILGNSVNLTKNFYSFFHSRIPSGSITNPYQKVVEKEEGLE